MWLKSALAIWRIIVMIWLIEDNTAKVFPTKAQLMQEFPSIYHGNEEVQSRL